MEIKKGKKREGKRGKENWREKEKRLSVARGTEREKVGKEEREGEGEREGVGQGQGR